MAVRFSVILNESFRCKSLVHLMSARLWLFENFTKIFLMLESCFWFYDYFVYKKWSAMFFFALL